MSCSRRVRRLAERILDMSGGEELGSDDSTRERVMREAESFVRAIGLPVVDWELIFSNDRWWIRTTLSDDFADDDVYWLASDTRNGVEFERADYEGR